MLEEDRRIEEWRRIAAALLITRRSATAKPKAAARARRLSKANPRRKRASK